MVPTVERRDHHRYVLLQTLKDKEKEVAPTVLQQGPCLVTAVERDNEVEWICRIASEIYLGMDTVCLAVTILDRILTVSRVQTRYLNCVALTSLYLSTKLCEELERIPTIGALLAHTGVEYSASEVFRMELAILTKLKWDLSLPTVHRYLQAMANLGCVPYGVCVLWRAFVERVLCDGAVFMTSRPGLLALSILSVSLETHQFPNWFGITAGLQSLLEISNEELISCREKVTVLLGLDDKENMLEKGGKRRTGKKRGARKRRRGRASTSTEVKTSRLKSSDNESEPFEIGEALLSMYG